MDRREFLKSALAVTALSSVAKLSAATGGAENGGGDKSVIDKNAQVSRRQFKDITLPLLGFGMMRLPRLDPEKPAIDYATTEKQIARAMEAGVNHFDTAYFYHDGLSEKCAGDLLTKYPRDSYTLANKMPVRAVKTAEDVSRIFAEQLQKCKTEYFDFYFVHNLNRKEWETTKRCNVYAYLREQQAAGKIRHLGFSFHDEPEVLQEIAAAHPWDFAMIQLNYLDWELYRSREQYEIVTKQKIPVMIMEPLRGGALANLNPQATGIFKNANPNVSNASWAFRYVASLPNVICILSGMTLNEHLEDNIKTLTNFKPLNDLEREIIATALAAYRKSGAIPCTLCRYCVPCPVGVDIPRIFGLYNQYKASGNFRHFELVYHKMNDDEKASACISCDVCIKKCPQNINIPAEFKKIEDDIAERAKKVAMYWSPDDMV